MNDEFKVLFIIPPLKTVFGEEDTGAPENPHVGVAYLVAMLRQNNIRFKIIDMCLGYTYLQVLNVIEQHRPNLICITCFSYAHDIAYKLIEEIRNARFSFNLPIVIGGPHSSAIRSKILEETRADFAVVGEGEHAIIELINELRGPNPCFEKVKGLIWNQNSHIVENKERPYCTQEELDGLPFPAYYDFEIDRYTCHDDKRLPIITSRGCPYQCDYCSVRLSMGNCFRARSPENVVNEIEYWYEKGWNKFDFNDDTFTLDMNRAARICELIKERGLGIRFYLYNGIRANRVDKDLLKLMKEAGCRFLAYGCESGNNSVLRVIKKGLQVEDVINAVNMTKEIGINQAVNFIIGHPTETYEKAMESIKLAKELNCDFVNFYNLIPYPNTDLFNWIESGNARFLYPVEVYLNKLCYRDLTPVFETDEFLAKDRTRALKQGFNLYEKTVMQFRFGKRAGYLSYLIARNRWMFKESRHLLMHTKTGSKIYRWITKKSY